MNFPYKFAAIYHCSKSIHECCGGGQWRQGLPEDEVEEDEEEEKSFSFIHEN